MSDSPRRPRPQNNPDWTPARDADLARDFAAGIEPVVIAEALGCTPGSVRGRINKLGLAVAACGPPDDTRPRQDDNTRGRRGDLAFKRAMLAAIHSGAETVRAEVVRGRAPTHWVRPLYGESILGYRSSAGLAAELGEG